MKKAIIAIAALAAGMATAATTPTIISSQVRANDPTVLDVVYRVTSDKPTVNVRALAFEDGERSFWKVVRPETFIDGTAANIGDNIAANVEHTLSWKVSSDWATDLAKVKFEVLTSEQGQLPLDLITIPATAKTPEVTVSYNSPSPTDVFNALLWYYADRASDIYITDGYLYKSNGDLLSNHTAPANIFLAVNYIFDKMGYTGRTGPILDFARVATRKDLFFNTSVQHVFPKEGLPDNLYIGEKAYCVIDVSGGTSASSYPVTYLDSCPIAGWGDEYKTTKILLRRIEPGSVLLGGIKPVTLTKPFYIGVFEITQKQYQLVTGSNTLSYKDDMRPVNGVIWDDIRGNSSIYNWPSVPTVDSLSFIGKLRAKTGLDFDLPTESQWEYACRAGTISDYNNGGSYANDLMQLGRFGFNYEYQGQGNINDGRGGYSEHTVVGSYSPNAWGLYDMHGNVCEWCLDCYGSINSNPATDFVGSSSGSARVIRGGSWNNLWTDECTSSCRKYGAPSDYDVDVLGTYGFRLARTLSTNE